MPDPVVPPGTVPADAKVSNIDVLGLIARLDRFSEEISGAQSTNLSSGLLPPDLLRVNDCLTDLVAFWKYAQAVPIPDSPEAYGKWMKVVPGDTGQTAPEKIENDDIRQLLYQIQVFRFELASCQSARFIHGFVPVPAGQPSDLQRITDAIARMQNFVTYVAATQPSDRPASTPEFPASPGGKTGTGL